MEEYKSITTTLTDAEQTIYNNSNGMIVKTILLQATTTNKKATLNIELEPMSRTFKKNMN